MQRASEHETARLQAERHRQLMLQQQQQAEERRRREEELRARQAEYAAKLVSFPDD